VQLIAADSLPQDGRE